MIKTIVFYNKYHNGDIHVSRSFVDYIIKARPQFKYIYTHRNPPNLLLDIPIAFDRQIIETIKPDQTFISGDTLFCCTWYGTFSKQYINKYKMSFECLYQIFKDFTSQYLYLDITKKDKKIFIPKIDFNAFGIGHIATYINEISSKKIFICNGATKSAQGYGLDLTKMTYQISKQFPDVTFFITNPPAKSMRNVIFTPDIIKTNQSDLNENAYIASKCDLVIGQLSGVHTFCYNQEMLNNNSRIMSFYRPTKQIQSPYFFDTVMTQSEMNKKFIIINERDYTKCLNHVIKAIQII